MNIKITKDGVEKITLTEYERRCMCVTELVLITVGRHSSSGEACEVAAATCRNTVKLLTPKEPKERCDD